MKLLSTIIYGWELLLILGLVLLPILFLKRFPTARQNWSGMSRVRQSSFILFGLVSIGCVITLSIGTYRTFAIMKIEGDYRMQRGVQTQLSAAETLVSIYWIDLGELPSGSDTEIWQTILNHHDLRDTWKRYENEYSATNEEGTLVDLWNTPVRFNFGSESAFELYSAGPDQKFSTDDDIPEKWEPTRRRS